MLADFKNRPQLEARLGMKPPEVAAVLAARAAMRVLAVAHGAKREGFPGVLVLPVFRATVFSWGAANYPAYKTEFAAALAAAAAAPLFWSALSTDATLLEKGATASVIARSPQWAQGQPDPFQSFWQEMKAALLAAKQEWQVWANWYDDRLEGRVSDETRELAYVRIEEALWDQGPAVVNAEIERRIAMSSYEERLRGRITDVESDEAYERIEAAISG